MNSFWSFVNKAKKSNSLPNVMYLRHRSASCRRSICNLLADQFKSVYRSDTFQPLALTDCSSLFISMQIEYDELISALSKLDNNIKSGADMIPPTSLSVAFLLLHSLYFFYSMNYLLPVLFSVNGSLPSFFLYSSQETKIPSKIIYRFPSYQP